ncbi:MAG TPA: AAA family ATPase [Candidatus Limnocylindrales bacterium]|jgi:cell division protease FtsH|nr:AAA family ATPase [Candidatus Limnocylindrales bacterium]
MPNLRRPLRSFGPLRRAALRGATAIRRRPRAAIVALTLLVLVGVIAGGSLILLTGRQPVAVSPATEPTFTFRDGWSLVELQRHVEAGEVEAITAVKGTSASGQPLENLLVRTSGGQVVPIDLSVTAGEAVSALTALGYGDLLTTEALEVKKPAVSEAPPNLLAIGLPITMLALTIFLVFRISRRNNPGQRDSSTFKTIMPAAPVADGDLPLPADPTLSATVRLDDVAGCDEAKLELTETIEFLRTPERFHKLGARIPRGIMLYGPPGTGKTMLARAVAAEAGVPFHHASGSEFVEKYVGVGAKRIRDLFAQARKLGRGVIFFDEFDALGKARGGPNSHEEREQTLNQLLVELDGFGTTDDVIVIAATNRIDTLDSAVLRPGRFNRKIHVGLPDVKGRKEILAVHARNKPLAEVVDLEETARKTYGFSGAMLADLLNESAILAARRSSETIDPEDLHGGWLKVAVGTSRRRSMDERERSIIAAHEVGHAICGKVHGDKRKVEEISLFAHGEALGVTVSSQEDNDLPSESDLRARLIALMGGRAAEELLFQEVTGGAANDFEAANKIATAMVTRWGMGRDPDASDTGISGRGTLSFLVPAPGGRSLPSDVQAAATRAIRSILDSAYAEACRTLIDNMDTLRRLAAYLVEHERVDGETFDELFDGRRPVPNGSDEWRAATARPRAWGEIVDLAAHRVRTVPVIVAAALTGAVASPEPAVAATVAPEAPTAAPEVASAASADALAARQASGRARRRGQGGRRVAIGHGPLPSRRLRLATANALHRAAGWLRSTEPEGDQL